MKKKLNCWEFKKCGRDLGAGENGNYTICPASTEVRLDGVHGGENAGRACWAVAGTMCKGGVQGNFAKKIRDCGECEFYRLVREEEGQDMLMTYELLGRLDEEADQSQRDGS